MQIAHLNLRSLQAFQAIMQTGSATAAAKQLGLTQPGISRLLASLEELVGFQLFYREHSRLIATEEAKHLTPEIDLLLSNSARFLELARNLHKTETGSLTIVAPASFNSGPLVNAVASFIEKYPRVSVSIDSHNPQVARDLVAQRSIDCGFIQLPENHPGLISVPILRSPMVCAVPVGFALAGKTVIGVNELLNTPLIMLGQGRPTRQKIDLMFKAAQVQPQIRLETHSVATACAYVKRGLGVAILNQVLAQQYTDDQILLIPLEPVIEHQYGFIYSAYAPMPRLVQAFYKHCIDYFNGTAEA
ncbi:transcriptional activator for lysine biosynthesis [Alishewanella agri BL06]|uniref:Transcriptional activator for lysine biosynthesis n=1 Tax=Alishewanella agri BL06 TaxID=1195246 RepID=I8U7N5_9ALTE|nr:MULTISPECIES: LysR family transcriptional regulator [Alishewanella]EIW88003.1 transcriptional activator for lysine biosynthesis [Alishewanella agri BL06]KRS22065.1 transcriptional regulator [Alishewanella sp. WH16-1]